MFKKLKRNFRARRATSDSDGEDVSGTDSATATPKQRSPVVEDSDSNAATSLPLRNDKKNKTKVDRNEKTVLSFGDDFDADDDAQVFKVKKSSHSKRVAKQLKKESRLEKEKRLKAEQEAQRIKDEEDKRKDLAAKENLNGNHGDSDRSISDFSDEEENKSSEVQSILKSGQIPDANIIHLARKQRQQRREQGDFVPLDDTVRAQEEQSRLVREDDNDLSDDDDSDRRFMAISREKQLREIETRILAAHEEDEDHSDHDDAWVEQQIRKGVSIPQVASDSPQLGGHDPYQQYVYSQSSNIFNPHAPALMSCNTSAATLERPSVKSNCKALIDLPQLTVEIVKKQLHERLEELSNTHRAHRLERTDMESRLESSQEAIITCTSRCDELERQSQFFQEMRGYVQDLVECLNNKNAEIDYLDRLMMAHFKQKAEKIIKRRQQDVKDMSEDFVPGKTEEGMRKAIDPEKHRRTQEREGRRARRRRAREAKHVVKHDDGMSTDEEMNNSETNKFNLERCRLVQDSSTIFDDVMEDFHRIDLVRKRFEEWAAEQKESYDEAYISLCLPKLFSPYVKLALIDWNPLEDGCKSFEEMPWFEQLMFYGYRDGEPMSADNPDIKLIPSLVEKVLLPKITALVDTVWDPLSSGQTLRLVNTLHKLMADYPTVNAKSKNTQLVFLAIYKRIKKSIDDDVFIPLYPKQQLEKKSSGEWAFFNRQFWSCVKLLRNTLAWQGLLSDSKLKELGMDCLLNRYLILGLMNTPHSMDALHRAQVVTATLPKVWFSELKAESTLPQLENLCRFLSNTAVSLGCQTPLTAEDREGLKNLQDACEHSFPGPRTNSCQQIQCSAMTFKTPCYLLMIQTFKCII